MMQPSNAAPAAPAGFVGIDWADQAHAVCLSAADAAQSEQFEIKHNPEAIAEFVAMLRRRFGGQPVAIALEQSRGALLYALMSYEFLILYPINPLTVKRYRDAFATSGAKDDPVDARLAWELLVKHRDRLRPWRPDTQLVRQLSLLNEHRRDFVNERSRLVQQLRAALKTYFPQALDWVGEDLATPLACDWLRRWSTLAAVQRARPQSIRSFYYGHRCRRPDLVQERLAQIKAAQPLTTDPAVIDAHALRVRVLATQLRSLLPAIAAYDRQIEALYREHPDRAIFGSFLGAGPCLEPRLAAAFGTQRERFPTARAIAQLSGVAPVTQRSGQLRKVHRRHACSKFLLQTFHEYAGCSIRFCAWAQAYYQAKRKQGKRHHVAVRALAFKWIRILWRCWYDRVAYDDAKYTAALQRHGSPLAAQLPAAMPDGPAPRPCE